MGLLESLLLLCYDAFYPLLVCFGLSARLRAPARPDFEPAASESAFEKALAVDADRLWYLMLIPLVFAGSPGSPIVPPAVGLLVVFLHCSYLTRYV